MSPRMLPSVTEVEAENFIFPSMAKPRGSDNTLFLGGASVRGLVVDGKYTKYTVIGVYLEAKAVTTLASKWKGKTADELNNSVEFFRDIVTGPFEKFTQVSFITLLMGLQYVTKVTENCIAFWNADGGYSLEEAGAVDKLIEVFKDQTFPPGSSIFFTHLANGSYLVSFSKHDSIPEKGKAVIENNELGGTVLETIIGKNGVSPAAAGRNMAERLAQLMNQEQLN